jgi:hypothetical protein
MGRNSAFLEVESILLAWYLQAWASGIPVDSSILHENAKQIADGMQVHNFAASDGWIYRFKDHHGLIHKNLFGESTATKSGNKGPVASEATNITGRI